ncbi:MBL fold metallo-hydrolase [Corynebacterium sanguinis]|uniref:MBL fold metallo-hydrolase n=1 Tax=Corynebacterium sanguinis TaxID=2594913 RepID=UPI0011A200AC|nr:MBL fold metallo-hydrolase [Corynebacterium sanguinis]MCT1614690.1 MBL fold metallo-hydrolase [Corynebacterium sanguinis]MCT1695152.1 MBL fold metallo-hydrolase [Corynebacterium sanguinis]MCT1714648.1 MBL fold metallo-hydrolase [Corynebacterium sanguinis]MCT2252078.1 MBL fold metallo-hydrolase [Corynebacterium sanguinis]TVS23812.1 MBL fold metallo-hydrolase [Corynebacterium sanguinis]
MALKIDHVLTSGVFALDGGEWDVDNNVWIVGDDTEVYIIDAAHDAEAIAKAVGDRKVKGIIATHGHNDHVDAAPLLSKLVDAPVYLHPGDDMLWFDANPAEKFVEMADGEVFKIAGTELKVLSTPGHSPGSVVLYAEEAGELFSGDTLFQGGPGATGRSYSSFDTIIESLQKRVLDLPAETVVRTGHGDHTTIGEEAPHLEEWIKRGY